MENDGTKWGAQGAGCRGTWDELMHKDCQPLKSVYYAHIQYIHEPGIRVV